MGKHEVPKEMTRRIPIALGLATLWGLTLGAVACQPDLGDPTSRQADWDAQAPDDDGGGSSNTNNELALWQPECGIDGFYACPPYGLKRGDIIENKFFAVGNPEAQQWANDDGIFSLADYYQSDAKLLFVYYGRED